MMVVVETCLSIVFEALSVIFCLHYLYGKRAKADMLTIGLVIFDVIWMEIVHFLPLDETWTLLIYPVIALYCGVEFGFNIKTIFVNNILYMIFISVIQATIMLLLSVVYQNSRMEIKIADGLIINIIIFCIVIFVLRRCKLKKLSDVLQRSERLIIVSFLVVVASTAIFLLCYKQQNSFEMLYYMVFGITGILIVITAIDIGKHKMKAMEAEAELRLHRLYEASFQNLIDDICAKQHEFDNHINTIYSQHFLYKTYDELVEAQKKYCHEIQGENHFNKLLSKGNPVILSFLYSKFLEIEKSGIVVDYKVNIGNLECSMPIYKMVELLGNLINNAVDAVKAQNTKGIYVMMIEEKSEIQIEVSNRGAKIDHKRFQEIFKKGYSEKGKNRGYGLYNVKKICEEYDVKLTCENKENQNENWVVFSMIINKPL